MTYPTTYNFLVVVVVGIRQHDHHHPLIDCNASKLVSRFCVDRVAPVNDENDDGDVDDEQ